MKFLIGLVLVGGIVLSVVYVSSIKTFDPTDQGKKAKAALAPGMTWNAVIANAGKPGKYRTMMRVKERIAGDEVEIIKPGAQLSFDQSLFESDFKAKNMPDGFIFEYVFSHQAAFAVSFDSGGRSTSIEDLRTMADLLGTRGD